ncbi:MAG: phosphoenolpyruvate carboxylase [Longimicrobiales bacterium]|nr:phosphoenolpyruvate carboxylase [Longimicrobiales bacterium]
MTNKPDLREVPFEPKDEPLRQDVRLLGDLVGAVIREQGGERLFECVEAARHAAIRRREGVAGAATELEGVLAGLDAREAAEIVRAFSTYFQVVNLAERVHRVRRGREHMRADGAPQEGSLENTVQRLLDAGVAPERIVEVFRASRVEPVFTAHPTESTRRVILDKQERIARELLERLDPTRTPHDERTSWAVIREAVATAWQTEEHPSERPTVADEREHVLYYVSGVLYRVAPALHEHLEAALIRAGIAPPGDAPPLLRPGSWVGGDMDGNPNVDADTLRATLARHRSLALEAYGKEIRTLAGQLTQSSSRVRWSAAVSERTEVYGRWFPAVAVAIPARHADMGYRVFLELVTARLGATLKDAEHAYPGPDELAADVGLVAGSLKEHHGEHAGLFGVRRLLRRIRTFGFHMAALDVRQDARELREVVADLLADPGWPERDPADRTARLHELLEADGAGEGEGAAGAKIRDRGDRVRRTLDVFAAIREGRSRYGADAIGSYIISMAQDVDDVLTVLWLATLGGLGPADDLPLDVTPLFETVPDLERAEDILDRLFADARVGPHLARRGNRQVVMVGYSDSNKDGGIAAARWALQRALQGMADAATRHGVTLTVFHGRGGTVSRGGGSVHRAVSAMPAASIGGRLRLTEQGEVIDAKYGLAPIAVRNLERMLGAMVLRAATAGEDPDPAPWHPVADTLAEAARSAYRGLVYEDPRFTAFFRSATPIDVIERMAIGSRPASRRSGAGVQDLRAIPWVFSWTQCRSMLTGWYGLGAGLEAAADAHGMDTLRRAAREWSFLDAMLADVEMVLAKADLDIARMYTALVDGEAGALFHRVQEEFERTVSHVLEIRGATTLLESEPTLRRSIRLRNPYVDPMNILQVDLLRRWRAQDRPDGPLLTALLSTVNGIARGLQNTG